jgi:ribonucleoside-diphosphate reductase beta chain
MNKGEKFIFVSNLKYQILLDSIQSRGVATTLLQIVTNPELEGVILTWSFFEAIHSRSYTYMIRNVFSDPSEVLDHILDIPEIIERTNSIVKYYDDFLKIKDKYVVDPSSVDSTELKSKLYLCLMAINILEGVRFYVSFACNFAFGENKKLEGSAKILSLIARDEAQHLALTQTIIKMFRTGGQGDEWKKIADDCAPQCVEMFKEAAGQEKAWADYLFSEGSMLGLNSTVLHLYVDHITNKRMRAVGLEPIFQATKNPLSWMQNWLNSKSIQVAPQESEIESYLVGAINSELNNDDFDDLGF